MLCYAMSRIIPTFHCYPFHETDLLLGVSPLASAAIQGKTIISKSSNSHGCALVPVIRLRNSNRQVLKFANISAPPATAVELESATDVVRKFYDGINGRDLDSVEKLISLNCIYEDLVFPRPFLGRVAVVEFFKKFTDSINGDLQFVIDDISEEDASGVGVTWHLEWNGKAFPFSKGCSFYRLDVINGQRQIVYGRDSVEPAIKPGETALIAIKAVTWLLQKFPSLADRL